MKLLSTISFIVLLFYIINLLAEAFSKVINPLYLPKEAFRELNIVSDDFTAKEFFASFEINMISGQNNYEEYYRQCTDGTYFVLKSY